MSFVRAQALAAFDRRSDSARQAIEQRYVVIKELGSGTAANVFSCVPRAVADSVQADFKRHASFSAGREEAMTTIRASLVAVKVSRDETGHQSLNNEIAICRSLARHRNTNIVRVLDAGTGNNQRWYSMPMACSSVWDLVSKFDTDTLPASLLYHISLEVIKALLFLQYGTNGRSGFWSRRWTPIVHGDVHDGNFLLLPAKPGKSYRDYPDVVLADFGYAETVGTGDEWKSNMLNDDITYGSQFLQDTVKLTDNCKLLNELGLLSFRDNDPETRLKTFIKFAERRRNYLYKPLSGELNAYLNREAVSELDLEGAFPQLRKLRVSNAAVQPSFSEMVNATLQDSVR